MASISSQSCNSHHLDPLPFQSLAEQPMARDSHRHHKSGTVEVSRQGQKSVTGAEDARPGKGLKYQKRDHHLGSAGRCPIPPVDGVAAEKARSKGRVDALTRGIIA